MWSSSDLKVNYNHSVLNLDCNSQDHAIKLHYKFADVNKLETSSLDPQDPA